MGKPDQGSAATGDAAGRGRVSARRKRETVLRLLRGEDLESVSRELGHPAVQHVRPLLEGERFHRAARGGLHLHRVPLIAPVQPDVRRQLLIGSHGPSSSGTRAWLRPSAGPIVES